MKYAQGILHFYKWRRTSNDRHALLTDTAKAYIRETKLARQMLSSVGKIIGRDGKNHDISDLKEDMTNIVEHVFKEALKNAFQLYVDKPE